MGPLDRYRATGADLPGQFPTRAHPGVAMEGYFWRVTDPAKLRETLELSFAQFQADRAVVDQARELRAEQDSLAGYDRAAARAQGSDRTRWEERARKREADPVGA